MWYIALHPTTSAFLLYKLAMEFQASETFGLFNESFTIFGISFNWSLRSSSVDQRNRPPMACGEGRSTWGLRCAAANPNSWILTPLQSNGAQQVTILYLTIHKISLTTLQVLVKWMSKIVWWVVVLFIVAGDVISILANNGVKGVLIFGGIIMTEKKEKKKNFVWQ